MVWVLVAKFKFEGCAPIVEAILFLKSLRQFKFKALWAEISFFLQFSLITRCFFNLYLCYDRKLMDLKICNKKNTVESYRLKKANWSLFF